MTIATQAPTSPSDPGLQRPHTRGDCLPGGCNEERPCPWVTCKWHLWPPVAAKSNGEVRLAVVPDIDSLPLVRLNNSCALDVADRAATREVPYSSAELAEILGCTPQNVRNAAARAMHKLRMHFSDGTVCHHPATDVMEDAPLSAIDFDGGE